MPRTPLKKMAYEQYADLRDEHIHGSTERLVHNDGVDEIDDVIEDELIGRKRLLTEPKETKKPKIQPRKFSNENMSDCVTELLLDDSETEPTMENGMY